MLVRLSVDYVHVEYEFNSIKFGFELILIDHTPIQYGIASLEDILLGSTSGSGTKFKTTRRTITTSTNEKGRFYLRQEEMMNVPRREFSKQVFGMLGFSGPPLKDNITRVLTLEYKTQEGGELCPCLIFANNQLD